MNENWEIRATPHFSKAYCPKHSNPMIELENGWLGNPRWWCGECMACYKLDFRKMKEWNHEEVNRQLKAKIKHKS